MRRFFRLAAGGLMLATALSAHGQDAKTYSQSPAKQPAQQADEKPAAPAPKPQAPKKFSGPKPTWIWGGVPAGANDVYFFRKTFTAENVKAAELVAACDNDLTVYINGKQAGAGTEWSAPIYRQVGKLIKNGENEIVVRGANQGGPAGMMLRLELEAKDGKKTYISSDPTWTVSQSKDDKKSLKTAIALGKVGVAPWNNVLEKPPAVQVAGGIPRNVFQTLPGFEVELLFDVPKGELGSWVCIAFDNKGRLIASDQGGKGLCRITPAPLDGSGETKIEKLDLKITSAQGMLYAFDSLYLSVNGGPGSGFYRARDTNGDDQYDEVKLLKRFQGGGEHGPHALRLSPDGKSIYVIAGNHTTPPEKFQSSTIPSNWKEDLLLPRQWDARGHARGKLAPGGWVARTDPAGETWDIFSIGYRNPYDMDFNADGELFAYDADMEWDMGAPWYRPTRVVHAVSGSEFGWRSGTGKWPPYYLDSLPPAVDIGPGSPVGATFGYGTKFPAKYQKALYILDWTFGTMYAIHTEADGASYKAMKEEFLSRTPLPLTDAAVGPDGALYFTIGGRGANSALFRVTYQGQESTEPVDATDKKFADLRKLRRQLETFHTTKAGAIVTAWPHLGHADRHIRYAARVALEHQDTASWSDKALSEKAPQARITALAGLARQGDPELASQITDALGEIAWSDLSDDQRLELLRTYALTFARMGEPDAAAKAAIAKRLEPHFPSKNKNVWINRELSRVLVYLNSPAVINKTLALMETSEELPAEDMQALLARNSGYGGSIAKMFSNPPELQKIHYALVLRNMQYGWTLEQRKAYFEWLNQAGERSGGASYTGFINNIRKEALAKLTDSEKRALDADVLSPPPKESELPKPKGPGRAWRVAELLASAEKGLSSGRNFENGKRTYAAARCVVCHRFLGEGGATGPDLSNVAGRFGLKELGEALIEPSKVISDQYKASNVITADGKVIAGRIVNDADGKLTIMTDPQDATKIAVVAKEDVEQVTPSKVSLMPAKLLDTLSEEEVLDLLAYMLSRGDRNHPSFAK